MFDGTDDSGDTVGADRKPPELRSQEVGNVAQARYNSLGQATRRLIRIVDPGGYTLSKSEDNGGGIRTLDGDTLFRRTASACSGFVGVRRPHRFVASILCSCRSARQAVAETGVGAAIPAGGRSARSSTSRADLRTAYWHRRSTPAAAGPSEHHGGSDPAATSRRSRGGSAPPCVETGGTWGTAGHPHLLRPRHHGTWYQPIIRNFRRAARPCSSEIEAFSVLNTRSERSEHDVSSRCRLHHHHEKTDAGAAARIEVRVLISYWP
jgi:hypothetical protein